MANEFIGRKSELGLLKGLRDKNTSSLVVVYGRRRIGKSSLIEEFGKTSKFYVFTGIAPQDNTTKETQLDEFSEQLSKQFATEKKQFTDWGRAFSELASYTTSGEITILLDEITWMGNKDSNFLGKLKNAWDLEFKKNNRLILVLCGSVSSWINKNILLNTGFYGRISLKIHLKEMPLSDCNRFWSDKKIAAEEKLKILSVTGGIPKYLEEIKTNISAEENIKQLCFLREGLLFNDFDYIFSALLERKSQYYEEIVTLLSDGKIEYSKIVQNLQSSKGGMLSTYIDELLISGLVEKDYTWQFKTGKISKFSKYRLADNYLRFYIKYIRPNISKILNNQFSDQSLGSLPSYSSMMGYQIENLVLNNRKDIKNLIGIYPDEVVFDNPYFQRPTERHKGCQVDYMIQTRFGTLYLCEIKFSRDVIRKDIIEEIEKKIKNLAIPKNFSIRPVLIHTSWVHDNVLDSNYFAKIINLSDLLKNDNNSL